MTATRLGNIAGPVGTPRLLRIFPTRGSEFEITPVIVREGGQVCEEVAVPMADSKALASPKSLYPLEEENLSHNSELNSSSRGISFVPRT